MSHQQSSDRLHIGIIGITIGTLSAIITAVGLLLTLTTVIETIAALTFGSFVTIVVLLLYVVICL